MKRGILIIILINLGTSLLQAQPCLNNWGYRVPIEISNTSSNTLNDFQVLLEINSQALIASGKLKTDGSDLRFKDASGSDISYWINPETINQTQTKVWVKVDLTALSTTTIYMFYGNSSAISGSNGNHTFILFDDFIGSIVDNSIWTACGNGNISVSGGNAIFTTTASQQATLKSIIPYNAASQAIFTEANILSQTGSGVFIGQYKSNDSGYGFYNDGTKHIVEITNGSTCFSHSSILNTTASFTDGICNFSWYATGNQWMNIDGNNATATGGIPLDNPIYSVIGNSGIAGTVEIDWVRTRKYIAQANVPTYTFQAEEVLPTSDAAQIQSNSPICEGETIQLSVESISGASYTWAPVSSNAHTLTIPNAKPINSGTYYVTISNPSSGCSEVIGETQVLVSQTTEAGSLSGANQVCSGNNRGTVNLNGAIGSIIRWEYSNTGDAPWASIANIADSLEYFNLLQNTYYRSIVKSGTCVLEISDSVLIQVDEITQGGTLFGEAEHCYDNNSGTLILTEYTGTILGWQSTNDNSSWLDITNVTNELTYNNLIDTTVYRVIVKSGVCETDTSTLSQITIFPLPIVDFISDTVSLGYATNFTNRTTIASGNIINYNWDFTTGEGSQVINPIYEFAIADTFQVFLQAISNKGCIDSVRKNVLVKNIPQIDFSFKNTCANDTVYFKNQTSFNGIVSFLWDFGDGIGISTNESPSYTYQREGTYTVKLIVSSSANIDSITKQIVIYPRAIPNFSAQNVCTGKQMDFLNNSRISSGGITYNWDFGDGNTNISVNPKHLYALQGTYNVELIATTNFGCKDTIKKNVTANKQPMAYFKFDAMCSGFPVQFNDSSYYQSSGLIDSNQCNYSWSFGDGNISVLTNPINNFTTPGAFVVELTLTTDSGCVSNYSSSLESYPNPIANFTVSDGCYGFVSEFSNQSTIISGSFNSKWSFDDGNTSTQTTPSNLYSNAGIYNVHLLIESDKYCTDTITRKIEIFANPIADFSADNVCDGELTHFINQSTADAPVAIILNNWDFGNGTNSIQTNPKIQFLNPDTYNVSLIIEASNGCKDTIMKPITVDDIPNAAFSVDNVCDKIQAEFLNASSIDNSSILSYQWTFGDGDSSVVENPTHAYSNDGIYSVKLKVLSPNNCADSAYQDITIYELPNAHAGTDTSISLGYTVTLEASGGTNYFWSPFEPLDDAYTRNPTARPIETTDFILKVTDNNSCVYFDTVRVEIINDFNLVINNVITPDGNGQNDVWIINNIENYDDNKVVIFDRWGNEVYVEEAYKNTWNGVNKNGDILPDGTYYYFISSESVEKVYKGAITVLRNK